MTRLPTDFDPVLDRALVGGKMHDLLEHMEQVGHELAILDEKLGELEDLERYHAGTYWRDDKYLYIIYPSENGQRKREYIGADPEKVAEALAPIRRHKLYTYLCNEFERKMLQYRGFKVEIDHLLYRFTGRQKRLWEPT